MVTFNINIGRKVAVFFVAFFAVTLGISVVIAYNPSFFGGVPSEFGHSSDEVMVKIGAIEKTLQEAINNNDFGVGGGGGVSFTGVPNESARERMDLVNDAGTYNEFCPEGFVVYGIRYDSSSDDHITAIWCAPLIPVEASPSEGSNFGGMYQITYGTICHNPNPLTGDCSCPPGYSSAVLDCVNGECGRDIYWCYN